MDALPPADARRTKRGFTLTELLVVIAIVVLLIAVLLPTLALARRSSQTTGCASNLQQLGRGLALYLNDFPERMPQAFEPGTTTIVGTLFGGARGSLPAFGINQLGAAGRPLNSYVGVRDPLPDAGAERVEVDVFQSPADRGARNLPGLGQVASFYELLGSSYAMNDHAPDNDPAVELIPTLVPQGGGRMPIVRSPSITVAFASHTIYNYDDGNDRQSLWYGATETDPLANVCMLDGSVMTRVGVEETSPGQPAVATRDYTFLPRRDWLEKLGL